MKTVLCCGCFDLLHPGHIAHLRQAQTFGDSLIVALTLDEYVGKGPGRPIYSWAERAEMLLALRCVAEVYPSKRGGDAILALRPNVYAKGIDYAGKGLLPYEIEACTAVGAEIRFTDTPKIGASQIIERIKACASC